MFKSRQRAEWSRTVSVVSWLFQGQRRPTAEEIAPGIFAKTQAVQVRKTAEQLQIESDLAWAQMHAFFHRKQGA